jgi:hypothetical protein
MPSAAIFGGEPGTTWVNDSDRVRYQFVAALINTCGACLQWHLQIGPWWGIPIHWGCRCVQHAIRPGAQAPQPFADFRAILDNMSYADQMHAIGASNYALLRNKVVTWSEIVTKYRVRTLREVIALNKVSLKTAIKCGVPRRAYIAWADANSSEAEIIREHRAKLLESIKAAGVSQHALVDALSRGLTSKVTLIAPGVNQSMAPFIARRPDPLAAELALIAARWRALTAGAVVPRKVDVATTTEKIAELPRVTAEGQPSPQGRYKATDDFFAGQAPPEDLARLAELRRQKTLAEWAKTGTVETVAIDTLLASQPTVKTSTVLDMLKDRPLMDQEAGLPVLFLFGGHLVIDDGHHRLAALRAAGKTTARVIVVRPP